MGNASRATPEVPTPGVAVRPEDFPLVDAFYVDCVMYGEWDLRTALLNRGLTPAADDIEQPCPVGTRSCLANCQSIKEVPVRWKKDTDERETSGHHWLHVWINKGTTAQQLYEGFRRAGAPCTDARVVRESSAEEPQGIGAVAFRTEEEFKAIRSDLPRSSKTDWTKDPTWRGSSKRLSLHAPMIVRWTEDVGLPDAKPSCGAMAFHQSRM